MITEEFIKSRLPDWTYFFTLSCTVILKALRIFPGSTIRIKSNNSQLVTRLEIKDNQEQQPDWQRANPNKMIWSYYREGFPGSSCKSKGVHCYSRHCTEAPTFSEVCNSPGVEPAVSSCTWWGKVESWNHRLPLLWKVMLSSTACVRRSPVSVSTCVRIVSENTGGQLHSQ